MCKSECLNILELQQLVFVFMFCGPTLRPHSRFGPPHVDSMVTALVQRQSTNTGVK